jgi:hypothetical protein
MSGRDIAVIQPSTNPGSKSTVLCGRQDQIEFVIDDQGNAEIIQTAWPDENQVIRISHDNIGNFLDRLTDALGIPSVGGSNR